MVYHWVLIPITTAFTGWFVNWLLFRMLFHPRMPRKFLGITLQGTIPANRQRFITGLSAMVSRELLSFNAIEEKITRPENVQKIMPHVEAHIDHFLRVKLAEKMPVISMFIGEKTINDLKSVFLNELQELFPAVMSQYVQNLEKDFDVEKLVAEKLSAVDTGRLEAEITKKMGPVFLKAGFVGLLIGLIEVGILALYQSLTA